MRAIFVIDATSNERSPLVQRLRCQGYLVLSLADCRTAVEVLRCLLPDLMIINVAAMGIRATVEMLSALDGDGDGDGDGNDDGVQRPAARVLVVGAKLSDYQELAGRLPHGEIVPAACSTPDVVLEHVRRHAEPVCPPPGEAVPAAGGEHRDARRAALGTDRRMTGGPPVRVSWRWGGRYADATPTRLAARRSLARAIRRRIS